MSTTLVDFISNSMRQLHSTYSDSIADLTDEQLHWRANDRGCPIAFALWHYYRTEDNIIQFVLQRKSTVWLDNRLDEKFGLHRTAQGTGMSLEEAQAVRLTPKADFQKYMDDVAAATQALLATLTDEALAEKTTVKPLGEMPLSSAIGMMCLTHGFTHLGEIQHLRGLQGLKGMGQSRIVPNSPLSSPTARLTAFWRPLFV
jgi:hypothetical protein